MSLTSLLGAATLSARPAARAGDQEQTFRTLTRTVPVYATVTDGAGSLVRGLTREDFELFDEGHERPITQFGLRLVPITAVVLIDGSRSVVRDMDTLVDVVDHLIVRMMPGDRVRLGSFASDARLSPEFKDDPDDLIRFLHGRFNLRMGERTVLWDALDAAVAALADQDGQRVVLAFTDGQDTSSEKRDVDVLNRARRNNVTIYAVEIPASQAEPSGRRGLRRLEQLTLDTGGRTYAMNQTSLLNAVATALSGELHSQYLLGFTPDTFDGEIHRVDVRVKRRGLKVHSRSTYVADARKE